MFSILRPYIFSLDPEVAHDLAIKSLKANILSKFSMLKANARINFSAKRFKSTRFGCRILTKEQHNSLFKFNDFIEEIMTL